LRENALNKAQFNTNCKTQSVISITPTSPGTSVPSAANKRISALPCRNL